MDAHQLKLRSNFLIRRATRLASFALLAALITAPAAGQEPEPAQPAAGPEFCNCQGIEAAGSEAEKARLIQNSTQRESQCRDELGVSVLHQKKGQGARMDACRCPCLNPMGERTQGPWGDQKKSGQQQGQVSRASKQEEQ